MSRASPLRRAAASEQAATPARDVWIAMTLLAEVRRGRIDLMSEGRSAEFRPFPNTRWSLIDRAGGTGGTATREALESLLRRYLPAMLAHLVGRRKIDSHRAADLVQAFVSDKVIEHNLIARADQRRGKFRSFFLTALDRYAIDKIRQEQAQKRLPNQALLDESIEAIAIDATDSDPFDRAWAHEVIDRSEEHTSELQSPYVISY